MVDIQRGRPTRPIDFSIPGRDVRARLGTTVPVPARVRERIGQVCPISLEPSELAESSRDWWPLAMQWALDGQVAGLAALIASPENAADVAEVLSICNESRIPVTTAGGRSGVCGASVPLHGGVIIDTTQLAGIRDVDTTSLLLDVGSGTFGDVLEDELNRAHNLTLGHFPQSIQLSTVGGWLACRGAGQMSNRYGKIEDMVVGLDVVLADGTILDTGGHTRASTGPDLTQMFVGSEGTLGVITGARLRLHHTPGPPALATYGFTTFSEANRACRRILQRDAKPAIMRVYDKIESDRSHDTGELNLLLIRNVGDPAIVAAEMAIVDQECTGAERLNDDHVETWWAHRNDVAGLEALTQKGFVVDTMEMTCSWGDLDNIYESVTSAIGALTHTRVVSAHQSHAYPDGACLYFTFAARPPAAEREKFYVDAWEAGTSSGLTSGASLSHHHGVGLNRSRFVRQALGPGAHDMLQALKTSLDPNGVLNPGKLGLDDPFGSPEWP